MDYGEMGDSVPLTGSFVAGRLRCTYVTPDDGGTAPPDVDPSDPNYEAIVRLYSAGILDGVDELGSFAPDAFIPREQLAAMATRVVDVTLRKTT